MIDKNNNTETPVYRIAPVRTIRELVEHGKNKGGDKNCLYKGKNNDEPLSFDELIRDLGTFILSLAKGQQNIALIGENSTEWIISCLAIMCSDNVAVPLDKDLGDDELIAMVRKCECQLLFYSKDNEEFVTKLKDAEPSIRTFLLSNIYDLVNIGADLINEGFDVYEKKIPAPDDLAAIIFTSGTSGDKKGVMLTHENLASDARFACESVMASNTLILLPLHHSFSWSAAMLPMFLYVVDAHVSPNMRRILKDLQRFKPQNISVVPMVAEMLYNGILNNVRKTGKENKLKLGLLFSRFLMKLGIDRRRAIFKEIHENLGGKLELLICGGAPLDTDVQRGLYDLGIDVVCGYGITECAPIAAVEHNGQHKFGSVGLPMGCNEIKIVDPDENGVGDILIRGINVMKGYYKDEEATREAFDGEWFKTGDYGRIDKDGYLFIVGRKKNLIVLSNGENVSPEELEQRLLKIDYVKEVAVYESDRKITAEFYLDESVPDREERINKDVELFNRSVPVYKNIGKVKIRDIPFEKTTTMKIKKYLLNEGRKEERQK